MTNELEEKELFQSVLFPTFTYFPAYIYLHYICIFDALCSRKCMMDGRSLKFSYLNISKSNYQANYELLIFQQNTWVLICTYRKPDHLIINF